MTREQGIELVMKHDPVRPPDLDIFLRAAEMTEQELLDMVEPMRDPAIWQKDSGGVWRTKDSVGNHVHDEGVESVRLPLKDNICPFIRTPQKISTHAQTMNEQTEYVIL